MNDNYRQREGNNLFSDTIETIIEARELYTVSGRNTFTYFHFYNELLALKWKQFSNLKQVITHSIKQVINRLQFKKKALKMSNSDAECEAHCYNQQNTF